MATGVADAAPMAVLRTRRACLLLGAAVSMLAVAVFVGVRYGFMLGIGLGIGAVLEGYRFGFAGPWRAMILRRDPAGILAQLLSIGLVAIVAIPLLTMRPAELTGAQAAIGWAMVGGAFVFGMAMQIVLGCGSGTLVNAGSGNPVGLLALPFFALGSFAGAWHLVAWTELGTLPQITLSGWSGAALTLALLGLAALLIWFLADPQYRRIPRRLLHAAIALALLALLNLAIAGQPWGVVYGLGLWVAKGVTASGADLSASAFWAAPGSVERVQASLLTDYTSLTNIGIVAGAFVVVNWRADALSQTFRTLPRQTWPLTMLAGFVLGYSSRLAFGCNVGAFYSGIATGSLHGWAWFAAAFAGSIAGVRLRARLGLESGS